MSTRAGSTVRSAVLGFALAVALGAAGAHALSSSAEPEGSARIGLPDEPTGLWWADGGAAQVEIRRCGEALCGWVVWLRSPFDEPGCPLRDERNPDPSLQDRGILGIQLLRGMRHVPDQVGVWRDGRVYDPASGRTYRATLTRQDPDRIELRGYVGIRLLGRTVTWRRVGSEGHCREAG